MILAFTQVWLQALARWCLGLLVQYRDTRGGAFRAGQSVGAEQERAEQVSEISALLKLLNMLTQRFDDDVTDDLTEVRHLPVLASQNQHVLLRRTHNKHGLRCEQCRQLRSSGYTDHLQSRGSCVLTVNRACERFLWHAMFPVCAARPPSHEDMVQMNENRVATKT